MYLPANSYKTNLSYGNEGNYDIGFLIGWNLGDGSITQRSDNDKIQYCFVISEDKKQAGITEKIENILESITGTKYIPTTRQREGKVWHEYHINNEQLRFIFNKYEVINKKNGLPKSIWYKTNDEFRKGLIDGLFSSDGYITNDRMSLISAHLPFINDVRELLGLYGIKSNIKYRKPQKGTFPNGKDYNKLYYGYDLTITNNNAVKFKQIFHLSDTLRQTKLDKFGDKRYTLLNDNYKVVSIEETDLYEDVWDISVYDDTHCFELGNCVTGNCGR